MAVWDFEALSVAGTAVGFTAATYDDAHKASCRVEGAAVRFRMDDTNPTATVGTVLEVGDAFELESHDEIQRIKFISRDGGTATINAHFTA
jgi:hypothetical protein